MVTSKKKYAFMSISLIIGSLVFSTNSEASTVTLINQSSNKLEVKVFPEPFRETQPYCWKCLKSCHKPGENSAQIIVPLESLCGGNEFAVVGSEGGFLDNGDCRHLSAFKNYELIFSEDVRGTTCVSREI